MARTLQQFIESRPEPEQKAIQRHTRKALREEATLRALRDALGTPQAEIADRMGIQQSAVSKIERRTDIFLSTLRSYIEATGGELEIVARYSDRPAVRITQFDDLRIVDK